LDKSPAQQSRHSPVGVIGEPTDGRPPENRPSVAPGSPRRPAEGTVPAVPALQLVGLGKRYGRTEAVREVNLVVNEGELLTLLGPSGSGKTTILKLVAGFTGTSSGSIYLRGRDVSRVSPAERGIGMVFQNYALFPHMTVTENVGYGLKMQKVPRDTRAVKVTEMLELVGLPGLGERLPRELSGGQQQRVALARALAFGPSLLLMDEPLGALDRELRERMMVELRRIHHDVGVSALYVTHDREEALVLSDRIGIMRDGTLEGVGTPAELLTSPPTRFIASFFGGHALLPASLIDRDADSGHATVRCLGQQASVRCQIAELQAGSDCRLVIPSGALSAQESDALPDSVLMLDVTVMECLDLGDHVRVSCQVRSPDGEPTSTRVRISGERLGALADGLEPGQSLRLQADASKLSLVS
jgi:ABC-type Fe3+/spermidine/putrescine transport system ATPase subunit